MTLPVSCLSSAVTSPKKHLIFVIYELFIINVSVVELSVKRYENPTLFQLDRDNFYNPDSISRD